MMVITVGPNAFAGTLAISFSSIGMLGKMISEIIEEKICEKIIHSQFNLSYSMRVLAVTAVQELF